MAETENILGKRKYEIYLLIANADHEAAFKRILDFSEDFASEIEDKINITIACSNFNQLKNKYQGMDTIPEDIMVDQNKILKRMLSLVEIISQNPLSLS